MYYPIYQNYVPILIPVSVRATRGADGWVYILADDLCEHFETVEGMRSAIWVDPKELKETK